MDEYSEMALRFYGYGRWDAKYWFIGLEEGQDREENDDLTPRLQAWRALGSTELCDLEQFCHAINLHKWHRDGKLQQTWRPLILLLLSFLKKPADTDCLRRYQRFEWGRTKGETCVIELSGQAANNQTVSRDRTSFRQKRIDIIRERINQNHPQLVLMYGAGQRSSWEQITRRSFPPGDILEFDGTKFAVARHPVSYGMSNAYWEELAQRLRNDGLKL
jgi:hypothetical protein